MAATSVQTVLAWLHIFTAIGWMGTAMFVVMLMTPLMPRLSSAARGELILKLFPRLIRYVSIFAGLTLLLGVLLAFAHVEGRLDELSPSTPWGLRITIGATLSLVALVLGPVSVSLTVRKIIRSVKQTQDSPQTTPPPELARLQKRMRILATTVLTLLTVILALMVIAAGIE